MLKKFYKIIIVPYTLFLLYLMFFGMGRTRMEDNLLTVEPIISTINFIKGCISWKEIVVIVVGNVVMFIPFGFLVGFFLNLKILKVYFLLLFQPLRLLKDFSILREWEFLK